MLSAAPFFGQEQLPAWYTFTAMGMSAGLAVLLRRFIPTGMKWLFLIAVGGLVLAFVGGVISAIIGRSS